VYGIRVLSEILLWVLPLPQHSSSLFPHCSEWQSKKAVRYVRWGSHLDRILILYFGGGTTYEYSISLLIAD
jgi:hypothetical protein